MFINTRIQNQALECRLVGVACQRGRRWATSGRQGARATPPPAVPAGGRACAPSTGESYAGESNRLAGGRTDEVTSWRASFPLIIAFGGRPEASAVQRSGVKFLKRKRTSPSSESARSRDQDIGFHLVRVPFIALRFIQLQFGFNSLGCSSELEGRSDRLNDHRSRKI